jgi:prophage regulatory protein
MNKPVSLMKRRAVEARTTLPKSSMYALMAKGEFPKPIKVSASGKAVAWTSDSIDRWIESRIAACEA